MQKYMSISTVKAHSPRNVEIYAVKRANTAFFVFFFFGCISEWTSVQQQRWQHFTRQCAQHEPMKRKHAPQAR